MQVGNVFSRVCLSVCLCLCMCLSMGIYVQALTFEMLNIETSFLNTDTSWHI